MMDAGVRDFEVMSKRMRMRMTEWLARMDVVDAKKDARKKKKLDEWMDE
jgi:hypothetical protein